MASGDTLLILNPLGSSHPASNFATLDLRNNHPVLDFDASTDETIYFEVRMPRHYDGGGITVALTWMASSATSGDVVWNVDIERENTDLDSDSFAGVNAATGTANGTSGIVTSTEITFTDGADMDSVAAGEPFRLAVIRDADNGSDTMTGDAELLSVEVRET